MCPVGNVGKAQEINLILEVLVVRRTANRSPPRVFVTQNVVESYNDIVSQTEFLLPKGELEPFISGSQMLTSFREGEIPRWEDTDEIGLEER
jgi:hypothetical protein